MIPRSGLRFLRLINNKEGDAVVDIRDAVSYTAITESLTKHVAEITERSGIRCQLQILRQQDFDPRRRRLVPRRRRLVRRRRRLVSWITRLAPVDEPFSCQDTPEHQSWPELRSKGSSIAPVLAGRK